MLKTRTKARNYLTPLSGTKTTSIVKIISTLIFYICLLLAYFPSIRYNVLEQGEMAFRDRIFNDLSGVILIATAFLLDKIFRQLLLGKLGTIYLIVILFYAFIGIISGNVKGHMLIHLEYYLWLPAGLAMFRLVTKSYRPKIQLLAIITLSTYLIYHIISKQAMELKIITGGTEIRVANAATISYTHVPSILTGLALAIFCRQGLFWLISILGLVALHVYSMVFLAATRTAALEILTCLLFSVIGLLYTMSNGLLATRIRTRKLIPILTTFGVILLFFIFLGVAGDTILEFLQNTMIFQRFFNPDASTQSSSELRIQEALAMFKSLNDFDFLLGRGLGASFVSPVFNYPIWFLHIGLFLWWLQGGFILFSVWFFLLYIKLPLLYFKSLLKPYAFDSRKRTALLTIMPGIFAYSVGILTNHGLDFNGFMPLGFSFGAYLHIRKYGLGIFFE